MELVVPIRPSMCVSVCQQRTTVLYYQSKVFVCVSVISRRMQIIAQMWSVGF